MLVPLLVLMVPMGDYGEPPEPTEPTTTWVTTSTSTEIVPTTSEPATTTTVVSVLPPPTVPSTTSSSTPTTSSSTVAQTPPTWPCPIDGRPYLLPDCELDICVAPDYTILWPYEPGQGDANDLQGVTGQLSVTCHQPVPNELPVTGANDVGPRLIAAGCLVAVGLALLTWVRRRPS